jgi:DNA polymerase-3 subunit delta'
MLKIYPWQNQVWENVSRQLAQNRLPHALLLEGPQGLGKLDFANALTERVLCQTHTSCGICRSCQLLNTFHPDLITLSPEEKSRSIKIDAVRAMIEKIQHTSVCGGYQVIIIHPAEAMNLNCANALLKTLEEPPQKIVFLLVTHQAEKLPATVLSRCQRLLFLPPTDTLALSWLKEKVDGGNLETLLRISEAAPLRALDLSERNYLGVRDQLLGFLQQLASQDESPISRTSEFQKQDPELFLLAFFTILLDMLRLLLQVDHSLLLNQDRAQELLSLCRHQNSAKIQASLQEVQQARELMLGHANPNIPLLIERLFLSFSGVGVRSC